MSSTASPELILDIELASLNRALASLANATGQRLGQVVKQNTRLIAWNLAHNTQPYGMTLAQKKIGEAAVMRDIGKVYQSAQAVFKLIADQDKQLAKQWYKLVQGGGYAAALKLLQSSKFTFRNTPIHDSLLPELHQKSRNSRGRVSRHRPAQIVPQAKQIKDYIKQRAKLVGFAKAGWITAGAALGSIRNVPAWITRHKGSSPGSADDQSNRRDDPYITLTNQVRYVSQILPDNEVAGALRIQREKMLAHIEHVLVHTARDSGFIATANRTSEPVPLAA